MDLQQHQEFDNEKGSIVSDMDELLQNRKQWEIP